MKCAFVQLSTINAGAGVEKGEPLTLLVGMQASTAAMESSVEIPHKTGDRAAIRPSNPTAGHTHHRKRHVHPSVHRSTVYNSQDMEAT